MKGNFGEALQLAFTFVPFGNGYPLAIRQFGLNLLEHVAKHLSLDRAGGRRCWRRAGSWSASGASGWVPVAWLLMLTRRLL